MGDQSSLSVGAISSVASGFNSLNGVKSLNGSTFKGVLRDIYGKLGDMTRDFADDDETVTVDGLTLDKTGAAAALAVSQATQQYKTLIDMMLSILNIFKDLDKAMGQSMSKG